jgi:hypothetical protein
MVFDRDKRRVSTRVRRASHVVLAGKGYIGTKIQHWTFCNQRCCTMFPAHLLRELSRESREKEATASGSNLLCCFTER